MRPGSGTTTLPAWAATIPETPSYFCMEPGHAMRVLPQMLGMMTKRIAAATGLVALSAIVLFAVAWMWPKKTPEVEALEASCHRNDARACYKLGFMWLKGDGVSADAPRAAGLFHRACQGGDMLACWTLGDMHYRGEGVALDKANAAALFEQVCQSGGETACLQLAEMYSTGDGVAASKQKAVELLRRVCDRGSAEACAELKSASASGASHTLGPKVGRE